MNIVRHGMPLTLLVLTGLVGCGADRPMGKIAGTVTYKGKPVREAEVHLLQREAGVGVVAPLDDTGRFVVAEQILAGEYSVAVMPQQPPPQPPVPGAPPPKLKQHDDIPGKARDPKSSGLTVRVNPGENDLAIELKD